MLIYVVYILTFVVRTQRFDDIYYIRTIPNRIEPALINKLACYDPQWDYNHGPLYFNLLFITVCMK